MINFRSSSGVSYIRSRAWPYRMLTLLLPSTRIFDTLQQPVCTITTKALLCWKCTEYASSSVKKTSARGCGRASRYCWVVVPPSFVDVDGPLIGGGAFYRGVLEDGIHLPVLNEGAAGAFVCGIGLPLYSNLRWSFVLRMNSRRYPSLTRF